MPLVLHAPVLQLIALLSSELMLALVYYAGKSGTIGTLWAAAILTVGSSPLGNGLATWTGLECVGLLGRFLLTH